MKPKSYTFKVQKIKQGKLLLDYLATELPEKLGISVSKSKIRMLIFAGAVYVDGKRIQKPHHTLVLDSEVMAYVDLNRLQSDRPSHQKKIELSETDVAYEDQDIIVINKPSGIPTQATVDNARDHLYAAVQRFLNQRSGTEVYVGLHHRLDYDTSGLILFTKKKSANFWVSELFKNKQIQKTYHAIAVPKVDSPRDVGMRWEVKNHIARAKNKGGGRVIHMEEVRSGGDLAHTSFLILKNIREHQLIQCEPHTGRTHQIRLHLKLSGQPIVGDVLYGGPKSQRVLLHAKELEFLHGGTKKKIKIEASYPEEFKL